MELKFMAFDKKHEAMGSIAEICWNPDFTIKTVRVILPIFQDTIMADVEEFFVDGNDVELFQFTGLHDKNGKEIYNGHIIKWVYHNQTAEVFWNYDRWGMRNKFFYGAFYKGIENKIEIIGHIMDNPPLKQTD
jgi:uncharacterized phage protein (TIGR01671 family)